MDHDFIERHSVVERYAAGRLSGGEEVRFEEHLVGCARCLEEVELAEDFQRSLRAAVADGMTRAAVGAGLLGWLRRRAAGPIALALLVVAGFGYLWWRTQALSGDLERLTAPQVNTAVITLAAARSAGDEDPPVNRLTLPENPGWLVLAMELALVEHDAYGVVLRDAGGRELWREDGLTPDALDTVTVSLHSSFLDPGDYVLELEGLGGGRRTAVGRYRFRVP